MKISLRALIIPVSGLICLVWCAPDVTAQGTITVGQTFCTAGIPCVTTYHNDNNRDGVNANETVFTPTSVKSHTFTTVIDHTDGLIYAQPLYIKALNGSNGKVGSCTSPTNIVFVATENNTVYALPLVPPPSLASCWQLNLNRSGESAIPYTSLPAQCPNLLPQMGITGTPVIDVSVTPPILYVVTSHQIGSGSGTTYAQRLHAIDTTTGLEESFSPIDIGSQLGSNFSAVGENQRPGLALSHPSSGVANIYISWASSCDVDPQGGFYNGWVAGFTLNYNSLSSGFSLIGSFTAEPTGASHKGVCGWLAARQQLTAAEIYISPSQTETLARQANQVWSGEIP